MIYGFFRDWTSFAELQNTSGLKSPQFYWLTLPKVNQVVNYTTQISTAKKVMRAQGDSVTTLELPSMPTITVIGFTGTLLIS
jgi:hypothetical protein